MGDRRSAGRGGYAGRRGGHGGSVAGEKVKDFRTTASRLIRFFGRQKGLLFLSLVLLMAAAGFNAVAPTVMGNAITNYLERDLNLPLFFQRMAVLIGLYVGGFIASSLGSVTINIISNRIIFRMRRDTFAHVHRLSISYFDRVGIGDIISRLTNDIEMVYNFISNGLISTLNALFTFIGILIAMILLNFSMTAVVLIIVPVIIVIVMRIGKIVKKAAQENQKKVGELTSAIEESVSGIKVIQSFHREEAEKNQFDNTNATARDAAVKMETSSYMMMPSMQLVAGLALVLVIGFGGSMVILRPSVFSVGMVAAFIVYARRIMEPFRQVANVYTMFNSALAGAERIFEVMDSREEIPRAENPVPADSINGHVEFKSVSFGYVPGKTVLENITFETHPGELTAIVGPTGAGKTTLINLLSRFYDVEQGEILVDGVNIKEYDLRKLRSKMGVVLQEPFFFATTIRKNLLFGKPDATEAEMIEAAKTANAHHFISCLPKGYDAELTERGMNLSQGERQLLGITRTILTDPRILILDEATSSVDSLTERKIQLAVRELMKGRTSLVIAHRLSTIKRADRVLVIHNRKIIERGTHEELMKADGFYRELYSLQFEKPEILEESFASESDGSS